MLFQRYVIVFRHRNVVAAAAAAAVVTFVKQNVITVSRLQYAAVGVVHVVRSVAAAVAAAVVLTRSFKLDTLRYHDIPDVRLIRSYPHRQSSGW